MLSFKHVLHGREHWTEAGAYLLDNLERRWANGANNLITLKIIPRFLKSNNFSKLK